MSVKKKVEGSFSTVKAWKLYSDVSQWSQWDEEISGVVLEDAFKAEVSGMMSFKNGQKMPFTLDNIVENKCFTTYSLLGSIKVVFTHEISDNFIIHRVEISGAPDIQLEEMGRLITAGLGVALNNLSVLSQK